MTIQQMLAEAQLAAEVANLAESLFGKGRVTSTITPTGIVTIEIKPSAPATGTPKLKKAPEPDAKNNPNS
jgi:hypothetical protein